MPNNFAFLIIAILTLASAVAAMRLRNLVHCALCVAASFAGLSAVYLQLDAEFVGFAQVLVYVGAVAILIVFATLMTRGMEVQAGVSIALPGWLTGIGVAGLVLASVALPILNSPSLQRMAPEKASAPVKQIGEA